MHWMLPGLGRWAGGHNPEECGGGRGGHSEAGVLVGESARESGWRMFDPFCMRHNADADATNP